MNSLVNNRAEVETGWYLRYYMHKVLKARRTLQRGHNYVKLLT